MSDPTIQSENSETRAGDVEERRLNTAKAVWDRRWSIILISLGVAAITAAVNFFWLWPYYQSSGTLLPETDKGKLAGLGSLANLAELAGVSTGGGTSLLKLYPAIIASETVLRPVILKQYENSRYGKPVNILDYFDISGDTEQERFDKGLKLVRELVGVSIDSKTNLVTITVLMPERQFSADVLNAIVGQMDDFMRHKQNSSAQEQAKWIAARVDSVEREMKIAQDRLREFREKNRRITDSPELLLVQERLMLEVQVKSTVYVELKKQYELAKIDEIKSLSVVNILDRGTAPVRKEKPKRAMNILFAFFTSVVFLSLYWGWARYALITQVARFRPIFLQPPVR